MSIYDEVAELTWENGELTMHGLNGLHQEKPTLNTAHNTLESIVQQATLQNQKSKYIVEDHHAPTCVSSMAASSGELQKVPTLTRKRAWSNSNFHGTNINMLEECGIPKSCASAGATFVRDNDTTMMTWGSLESGGSFKNKTLEEELSASQCGSDIRDNQDDRDSKAETAQTNSKRGKRTAAIHNYSERKRRDRINQKMKALQKLVPNACKTDKASMLDEVINYLKQLQAHIQMMNMTSMPQMIVPLAMQQQLQMSMLARMGAAGLGMGMGMGMGMVNINNMASQTTTTPPRSFPQIIQPTTIGAPITAPMFVPQSFMMPSLIQARALAPPKPEPASSGTNASITLLDPYSNSLTQPVNMEDIMNNMAVLYRQQMSQNNQATTPSAR